VADRNENAVNIDLGLAAVHGACELHAGDAVLIADDLVEDVVPEDLDVAGFGLLDQQIR
jgi:hypothetical protein